MKRLALYLSGPLSIALLAPLALGGAPLYPYVLIGSVPLALVFTLIVAIPLFIFGARKFGVRAPVFIGLSFVAGFASYLIYTSLSTPGYSSVGGTIYAVDGDLTGAGWKSAIAQSIAVGLASIPSGLLWWLGARIPLERPTHGA
jgi:hypothetical protein